MHVVVCFFSLSGLLGKYGRFIERYSDCRYDSSSLDNLGFASVTVWNMKTWKAMVCALLTKTLRTLRAWV